MRSRYSAYAHGDADYLFRTWHPRTRPPDLVLDPGVTWIGLQVTESLHEDDEHAVVAFTARFESAGRVEEMRERSRFQRRAGRWCYMDGDG